MSGQRSLRTGASAGHWLIPDWPVASHVKAVFTTRHGGTSLSPWDSFNLGDHVGDDAGHVSENRRSLARTLEVQPVFLKQVHGWDVLDIQSHTPQGSEADACWTHANGVACTIMVADCLPILFADKQGHWVAAAHAGWRGLAGQGGHGVIEATLARCQHALNEKAIALSDVCVWLGPCIGPQAFEVGAEVKTAFCDGFSLADSAFEPQPNGRYLADLAMLARQRLQWAGIDAVYGNDSTPSWCTHAQKSLFFSHRRDAGVLGTTGRMAACIWLDRA